MSDPSEKRKFVSGVFVVFYGLALISAVNFVVHAEYMQVVFIVGATFFLRFAHMNPDLLVGDPFLRGVSIGETKGPELVAVGALCWVIYLLAS